MGEINGLDNRDFLIGLFPNLTNDPCFNITSPLDKNYNCIAWAFSLYKNRWMQFDTPPRLDGVFYWWPTGVEVSPKITAYIEAFESVGFEICSNNKLDEKFIKIALYCDPQNNCTHAARQKTNGVWMSKLGQLWDIEHGTPESVEGDNYGNVYCIMAKNRL